MDSKQLYRQIRQKNSFLCIGLDTELSKLPGHLKNSELPLFEFNRQIIEATHDLVIAYKPNTAFYEAQGASGWQQLELTIRYIRQKFPDIMVIADAKRGDIGNTAMQYASAFYEELNCDAVTVAPYMGSDSVKPFLSYPGKWVVLLALTSNEGAEDFQFAHTGKTERLFETVIRVSKQWGNADNMMFVVGATRAGLLVKVREIIPEHFLLIPGVGKQGGDLNEVAEYGLNKQCGLIVNSSRAIIYADSSEHFASAARENAKEVQAQMEVILKNKFGNQQTTDN
jgi:orotidine-5'-phosphate decarboxylase